ncbi:MAG: phage baseplate assembly protein V [Paludibacterium sp.]|uniref:phage baseplate assembly protein V n=1 Tax=Paludibacterium sp. TaxID=1917523 RepID=UPI0025D56C57|nr:phage baseplate assembly protein V [Paludibacterium sp.]MBV8049005.1 phage baseplate assembly protein V [Paludibacterium sp.]MBV8647478.1 phage baseplate assembly protein V [Paludibacterium sp.]
MRALIQALSAQAATQGGFERLGTLTSYDPANHAVKVLIQPEGFETGWIRLAAPAVGRGWGILAGPQIGDEVAVGFENGDMNGGVVLARLFNDSNPPPSVPSGEFWLLHQSGSLLKFHNDGSVELTAAAGATYRATQHHFVGPVQMDNTLQVTQQIVGQGGMAVSGGSGAAMQVSGDMHSSGKISADGDVLAAGKSGASHTHHENGAGSNTSGPN